MDECLSRLESDPERVKSLVGWKWIRVERARTV